MKKAALADITEDQEYEEDGLEGDSQGLSSDKIDIEREDYGKIKSKLYERKSKVQILDPVYHAERIKRREARIKKFKEQSRWLANTAFQTYFGRPAFCNYGRANV